MHEDLVGKRFGKLIVLKEKGKNEHRAIVWECLCDCGNITETTTANLKSGHTKSCGCILAKMIGKTNYKHGDGGHKTRSRLYKIWTSMKQRCENPKSDSYKWYGAKGVRLCKEWDDYTVFKEWAFKNGYDENAEQWKCTIDRINPYGNYEPNNCRWVDMHTQNLNRRCNRSAHAEMSGGGEDENNSGC